MPSTSMVWWKSSSSVRAMAASRSFSLYRPSSVAVPRLTLTKSLQQRAHDRLGGVRHEDAPLQSGACVLTDQQRCIGQAA